MMERIQFNKYPTPIEYFGEYETNRIYIKRDDLTEPTLGGNKTRKLELFLAEARREKADTIVTYGAAQSNHCRVTVATANKLGLKTVLILAKDEDLNYNGNYLIYKLFDTEIVWTETNCVPETIDATLARLKEEGHAPYFIQGGGHGNPGTQAYKLAYDEIIEQEQDQSLNISHVFHASGTGTTQAGLIVGNKLANNNKQIIGISIARNKKRGMEVIAESIQDYIGEFEYDLKWTEKDIHFLDTYVGKGYADIYPEIIQTIKYVAKQSSLLLDPVYTGKAFYGMLDYIQTNNLKNQDVLFILTGGIPLLFNYASIFEEE